MTVLVVGATGTVGPHVVRGLAARQVPARSWPAMPATPRLSSPQAPTSAAVTPATMTTCWPRPTASRRCSCSARTTHQMADLQPRIIRVLRRTGIRIVKLSGTSSAINPDGPQACRQYWEIDHVLAASGQPYAVLRPNAFMQTLIDQIMLPAVKATGAIPNPIGTSGISFIDARDVGECAATVLASPQWDGQTLVLTGPRALSFAEIADLIGARADRQVGTREITPADVRRQLEEREMAR